MKIKKIAIFSNARSEFGILASLLEEINKTKDLELLLFAGGSHLSKKHGYTIKEIKNSGFKVDAKINIKIQGDTAYSLSEFSSLSQIEIAKIFKNFDFDCVCVVGDRFDILPVIFNAVIFNKLIIHLHGGEITEGAIDNQIRHMITKSAHVHFAISQKYVENILRMGEEKFRVHNTGALAISNIIKTEKIPISKILRDLKIHINKPIILLTYHPVTLEFKLSYEEQIENIFKALKKYDVQLIITSPGIDVNGEKILKKLIKIAEINPDYKYIDSLGYKVLYNLYPYLDFVIGNSSSGIIESPFFRIPTINIGERQKGRYMHESVITSDYSVKSIKTAIKKVYSKQFKYKLKKMHYKFGDGTANKKIVKILKKIDINNRLLRKKLSNINLNY